MKQFTVTQNSTLKAFTAATYPQGCFCFNSLLKRGDIKVNGVRRRSDCPVLSGDVVLYYTSAAEEEKPSHYAAFEDDNAYVADKLFGVSSEGLFSELSAKGINFPVHRLDTNTQGLIILAKTEECKNALFAAFKDKNVKKTYLCYAKNNFKAPSAEMSAYLLKDEKSGTVKIFPSSVKGAVKIVTEYRVEKEYGDYALVKIILHTGKTHQIRAHLAYIGCPVLGDSKYGDFALNKKYSVNRQILIAKSLKFSLTGEYSYLNDIDLVSRFNPSLR